MATTSTSSTNIEEEEVKCTQLYIGTAGYSYGHWRKGEFYPSSGVPQSEELRYFSGVFSAVEINASFHFVPKEETLLTWAKNAKPGFVFSFKVPQIITHEKRLEAINSDLDFFLKRLSRMEEARPNCLGPILFQLPPSLPKDISKLDRLSKQIPKTFRVAFEFRHQSWYSEEVYDAMQRYGFGLCDNISPDRSKIRRKGVEHNVELATTAGVWQYVRCHKRINQQITNYTDAQLSNIADELVERRHRKIVQYCYFLNDHEANGPRNAKTLIRLIKQKLSNPQNETASLVQNWKPDAVAPSIASMFAKSSSNSSSNSNILPVKGTKRPFHQGSGNKTKPSPRPFSSFFTAQEPNSTNSNNYTSTSPASKRARSTPPSSAPKKGSIQSFFAVKKK
ncbi:MAG: hypothetical protein SGBAC_005516 [Bacillariaceae sp.]